MYIHESFNHAGDIETKPTHVLAFELLCHTQPLSSPTIQAQSAPVAVNTEANSIMHAHNYVQCLIAQETSRKYEKRAYLALQETEEQVLSDLFIACYVRVKGGVETVSYRFLETVLTEMTENGALDNVFDCV